MYRRVLGLVALLALVFAVGCSKKKKDAGGGSGGLPSVSASTPQEAFDRFKAAMADEDEKTMLALLPPEQVDIAVEGPIMSGMSAVNRNYKFDTKGEAKKRDEETLAVLAKHGVSKEDLEKAPKEDFSGKFDFKKFHEQRKAHAKELAKKVSDKVGLILEMTELRKKGRKEPDEKGKKREQERKDAIRAATLKDVKIDGDKATAKFVVKGKDFKGKEREEVVPIAFKKVGDNWRIDISKD